jgi:hypothetical protein
MKIIKNKFLVTLAIILIECIQIKSAQAKQIQVPLPKRSGVSCDETIKSVKADLIRQKYFLPWTYNPGARPYKITPKIGFSKNDIRENYYDFPVGRENTVIVRTSGNPKYLNNFFRSPKLLTTISAKIISACPSVGKVDFPDYWEGNTPIGYFTDGTVRIFENIGVRSKDYIRMIETPKGSRLIFKWGYHASP